MASNNDYFYRGQNVKLKFYQQGSPIYMPAKSWSVEENCTEIAEGVNGEIRDRLDKVINFYSASVELYSLDQAVMNSIIAAQDQDDSEAAALKQTAAIQIHHRDGTKAAYLMKGVKAGPWSQAMSGRPDPVMLTLKMRFTTWQTVQAF